MTTTTTPAAPTTAKTASTDFFEVGADIKDAKAPAGAIEQKWSKRKFEAKLVNPSNRRKLTVIIVGLSALSITIAVAVISDMDQPYGGIFGIPSDSMRNALADMER